MNPRSQVYSSMDLEHFMKMALREAEAAYQAGEFPVGCVLVHCNRVLATGRRIGTADGGRNEVDHAEMLALRRLSQMMPPVEPTDITLFCTLEPCLMCYGAIILSGIKNIVYACEDVMGGGTSCDLARLNPLYRDAGIAIVPHILRSKSIRLLRDYFNRPENTYWKGSLLSGYIAKQ